MANDHARARAVTRGEAHHRGEWGVEFSRIVAFSDGVFAIAMTLLVLALDVPENSDDLTRALENQTGDLFAYGLSFAVLGRLWLAHHRFFSSLERFDGTLMALNLVYLAWIALVPFTSEVLGDYGENPDGVIVYAANMFGVTATFAIQIVYAYRGNLMHPDMRELERRFAGPANFFVSAVFLLSIPVALLSPGVAIAMWLLIFLTGRRVADRIAGTRTR